MSDLPDPIRHEVITELYQQAAELDWELLPLGEKKVQYRKWVEDPRVGGRLRGFFDDHRIGTWIKDTPMKEYSRSLEGFGSLAQFAAARYSPGPQELLTTALGSEWKISGSLHEKPMHCTAKSAAGERYVCWGAPTVFRDLTWAALNQAIRNRERPMIVVTIQDGLIVSNAEQALQRALAEHCGIDICYVQRHITTLDR